MITLPEQLHLTCGEFSTYSTWISATSEVIVGHTETQTQHQFIMLWHHDARRCITFHAAFRVSWQFDKQHYIRDCFRQIRWVCRSSAWYSDSNQVLIAGDRQRAEESVLWYTRCRPKLKLQAGRRRRRPRHYGTGFGSGRESRADDAAASQLPLDAMGGASREETGAKIYKLFSRRVLRIWMYIVFISLF